MQEQIGFWLCLSIFKITSNTVKLFLSTQAREQNTVQIVFEPEPPKHGNEHIITRKDEHRDVFI